MASGETKQQFQRPEAPLSLTFFGLWLCLHWQVLWYKGDHRAKESALRTESQLCIYVGSFFGLYLDFHPLFGF